MKSDKFYMQLGILTLLFAILIYVIQEFLSLVRMGSYIWYALGFFCLLTAVIYAIANMGSKASSKTFSTMVFAGMGLRMFFSILFIVIYLIFNPEWTKEFIVGFLILYSFYTMFEIYHLVTKLRTEKTAIVENTTSSNSDT